jgi:type II secretory pathway pseudopilin PulG
MRIQLNLASRPFVELGPLYLRLRILIVLLAVIAVPLWLLLATEKRKASEAQARLTAVEQQIQAIESQKQAFRRCGNRKTPLYCLSHSSLTGCSPTKPSPGPRS